MRDDQLPASADVGKPSATELAEQYKQLWLSLVRDEACDCVQGVFLRLVAHDPDRSWSDFGLSLAVRNAAIDHIRRERVRRAAHSALQMESGMGSALAEDRLSMPDSADRMQAILVALPKRCADVVSLRAAGNSYDAIARELRISRKTVDAQIQRARKLWRDRRERERESHYRGLSPRVTGEAQHT
jgi:RNA polymerase sigma factor (sigma-70 family)